ncbi:MAG: CRISPR-associated protein Cas2 [Chitinophagaceae bacterium]|nr:MAG: CRISPR-associated protein Cas2 [Chitinophagaceae bacterium]
MTIFLITYDLRNEKSSHDYQPLWDELAKFHCHRTQYSVWLGDFNNTAKEVHDHFRQLLDADDRLMVSELTKNHRCTKAMAGTTDWLANNPPQR